MTQNTVLMLDMFEYDMSLPLPVAPKSIVGMPYVVLSYTGAVPFLLAVRFPTLDCQLVTFAPSRVIVEESEASSQKMASVATNAGAATVVSRRYACVIVPSPASPFTVSVCPLRSTVAPASTVRTPSTVSSAVSV